MISRWRWSTLALALCILAVGLFLTHSGAQSRVATRRFIHTPAIHALHPVAVDANAREVTIIRKGCRVVFGVDHEGNLIGPGTVQVKVELTKDGTLSCTKHELDTYQSRE